MKLKEGENVIRADKSDISMPTVYRIVKILRFPQHGGYNKLYLPRHLENKIFEMHEFIVNSHFLQKDIYIIQAIKPLANERDNAIDAVFEDEICKYRPKESSPEDNSYDDVVIREKCLSDAKQCVCGDRDKQYGYPEHSFSIIAELWNTYLHEHMYDSKCELKPIDVANMMCLFKLGRITTSPTGGTYDSYVDLAGYAACAAEILEDERMRGRINEYEH